MKEEKTEDCSRRRLAWYGFGPPTAGAVLFAGWRPPPDTSPHFNLHSTLPPCDCSAYDNAASATLQKASELCDSDRTWQPVILDCPNTLIWCLDLLCFQGRKRGGVNQHSVTNHALSLVVAESSNPMRNTVSCQSPSDRCAAYLFLFSNILSSVRFVPATRMCMRTACLSTKLAPTHLIDLGAHAHAILIPSHQNQINGM